MNNVEFADYIVTSDETRENSYECAAWSQTVRLNLGEYPISGTLCTDGSIKDTIGFSVPGVVVEDYFQSLWCGQRIGKEYDRKQNAGNPATWSASSYCHALAKRILEGKETQIRLRPGFEARPVQFDYYGESRVTYGIFKIA